MRQPLDRPRKLRPKQAQRLQPPNSEAAQDSEELMGVAHLPVRGAEPIAVDLVVRAGRRGRGGQRELLARSLIGGAEAGKEGGPAGGVALRAEVDLVDGSAGGIEVLEAAVFAARPGLDHREAGVETAQEQPQIDLFAEHLAGVAEVREVAVGADPLNHGVWVAGECHDRTQRLERGELRGEVAL